MDFTCASQLSRCIPEKKSTVIKTAGSTPGATGTEQSPSPKEIKVLQ